MHAGTGESSIYVWGIVCRICSEITEIYKNMWGFWVCRDLAKVCRDIRDVQGYAGVCGTCRQQFAVSKMAQKQYALM